MGADAARKNTFAGRDADGTDNQAHTLRSTDALPSLNCKVAAPNAFQPGGGMRGVYHAPWALWPLFPLSGEDRKAVFGRVVRPSTGQWADPEASRAAGSSVLTLSEDLLEETDLERAWCREPSRGERSTRRLHSLTPVTEVNRNTWHVTLHTKINRLPSQEGQGTGRGCSGGLLS